MAQRWTRTTCGVDLSDCEGGLETSAKGEWVLYDDFAAAMDALQEMCRRDCRWSNGYYDSLGSETLRDALDVLVKAGRLEWVGEKRNQFAMAKDKEAQG